MKVETIRTTTLYLNLSPDELALIRESEWREIPPLAHDLVLHAAPGPGPTQMPQDDLLISA